MLNVVAFISVRAPPRRRPVPGRSSSGTGNPQVYSDADCTDGTAKGRRPQFRLAAACPATDGIARAASARAAPRSASRVVDARCSGPLSPPMYTAARAMRARSSPRSHSRSGGSAAGVESRARAASVTRRAASASDGPDATMMRRRGSPSARAAIIEENESSGQRRNSLPALTCTTTSRSSAPMPADSSRRATRSTLAASSAISTGSRSGVQSSIPSGASRSHWLTTEWRGNRSGDRRTRCV